MNTSRNPFGDPDGSRAPLDEHSNDFIRLDQRFGAVGQSIDGLLRTRVIVGGQGTGKTLFMRRLQQHYSGDLSVNSRQAILETSELDTETVIGFSQLFPQTTNSERWSAIWRRAITVAVAEGMLSPQERSQGSASLDGMRNLEAAVTRLRLPRGMDAVETAAYLCRKVQGASAFEGEIQHNAMWSELRHALEEVLPDSREQYIFIDAIDDNYHYAPAYWMACQRGLFHAVMHMMRRHGGTSNKLHVVITIRDLVMSSVYRGEHGARFAADATIVNLTWSWLAAQSFLESKIQSLDERLFPEGASRSVATFMGRQEIYNAARGKSEPIVQYLLRHTRLCPRDLIVLGNDLMNNAWGVGRRVAELSDEQIRFSVAGSASAFAHWNLAQAANQILTNIMPWNASRHDFARVYLSEDEYSAETVVREICSILLSCESEVFTQSALDAANREAALRFGSGAYFGDVMWQNRIIGIVDEQERPVFYRMWRDQLSQLPASRKYVINPLFIDKLPGIRLNDGILLNHQGLI